jgi:hypothetical protein
MTPGEKQPFRVRALVKLRFERSELFDSELFESHRACLKSVA